MFRNSALLIAAFVVAVSGVYLSGLLDDGENSVSGEPMVDVTVPALESTARAGEAVFNENCASCHGRNAAGNEGMGPPLIHRIYEPSHHADGSFVLAVRQGVRAHHWPFGNMPPIEGLTGNEVGRIVAYVRTLQRANGIN